MGPFELLDLVGGDVAHAVMVSIFEQYFDDPMYQPSANMAVRVAGGLLGRKSRQGFYDYDKPETVGPPTVAVSPQAKPKSAWIADEDGGRDLAHLAERSGRSGRARRTACGRADRALSPRWARMPRSACVRLNLDPARTVAVDMFGAFRGAALDEYAAHQREHAWHCACRSVAMKKRR